MKVTSIKEIKGTKREVEGVGFISYRPVLHSENVGFSVHKTCIEKGGPYHWQYKNHQEVCYCISGSGILTDDNGNRYHIAPDRIYILDRNDKHSFQALTDVVLISVFNPALKGQEIHDDEGSYEQIYNVGYGKT